MSDQKKQSGLGEMMSKVRAGAAALAAKKKPDPVNETEPTIGAAGEQETHDEQRPLIDDFSDSILIDAQDQPEPDKPAKKQWTTKKKIVLAAVAVCAVVMAKNGYFTPSLQHSTPATDVAAATPAQTAGGFSQEQKTPEKGLDVGLPSLGQSTATDPAVGQTLDQLNLTGPLQKPLESHDTMAGIPPQSPPPGDGFGFPASPSGAEAAPLTVSATAAMPTPPPEHIVDTDAGSPFAPDANTKSAPVSSSAPTGPVDTASLFGSIPTPTPPTPTPTSSTAATPTPSADPAPIPSTEKGAPVLGSTSFQNPDSSHQPSSQGSKADVKKLEAEIVQKDKQIKSLKDQLASKQAPKTAPVTAKHTVASLPKHSPAVAQRSTPRAVTPVAKIVTRPKLCVKAVAPPARNCTTCVAHAFVVDSGSENMVGQGDFLDGYRVSITGDRLDLQNSDGLVVHKFWSQPNGCPSI